MVVLIVLLASMLAYRAAGRLGVDGLNSWQSAATYALATMLLFTATTHFTSMREDFVRMMPPWIPRPRAIVYFTGLAEIAGALGLMFPRTRREAGLVLIAFFVAVFPANIRAARSGLTLRGRPPTPLWLRAPMQLLFIFIAWWASR
ncbi:MAG TPA: DoxX family protein [Candidatus Cybelea sp.]|nr:DoxX family protein [Candidatus Cybelea sp.]